MPLPSPGVSTLCMVARAIVTVWVAWLVFKISVTPDSFASEVELVASDGSKTACISCWSIFMLKLSFSSGLGPVSFAVNGEGTRRLSIAQRLPSSGLMAAVTGAAFTLTPGAKLPAIGTSSR